MVGADVEDLEDLGPSMALNHNDGHQSFQPSDDGQCTRGPSGSALCLTAEFFEFLRMRRRRAICSRGLQGRLHVGNKQKALHVYDVTIIRGPHHGNSHAAAAPRRSQKWQTGTLRQYPSAGKAIFET